MIMDANSNTSPMGPATAEPSLGELVRQLSGEASRLVRQEISLGRVELTGALRRTGRDLAMVAVGIALAAVGGLCLVACLVVLLGGLLGDYWLGALLVGAVMAGGGALGVASALQQLRRISLAPRETVESLQVTRRWAEREVAQARATLLGQAAAAGNGRGGAAPAAGPVSRISHTHREYTAAERRRKDSREGPGSGEPSPPPPKSAGLLPFLKHLGGEISADDVTGQAAKLAYYAFMAMPPALMALFGLAGLIGSEQFAQTVEREAAVALPAAVMDTIIRPFIEEVVLNKAPGPFSIGLLLALWGASSVFVGLMNSLNVAYDVEEGRSWFRQRAIALGVMFVSALLFIVAAVALLAAPDIVSALGLGATGKLVVSILQWPLGFGIMVVAFWIGYYVLPNRDQSSCKKVLLKASALAALLWVIATAAFRLYIANFSSYSETYGFLGAFIILLLWLYVTGIVVLAGGELASEMERRA